MKIAICLSGLTRDFKTIAPHTYEKLAAPLNADVFIHTWEEATHKTAMAFPNSDFGANKDLHSYLKSIFEPEKLFFKQEIQSAGEWNFLDTSRHRKEIAPMFYSIYMSNQLKCQHEKATGHKYDVVIRARLDHYFHEKYNFEEELRVIASDKKQIYVAFNGTHRDTRKLPNGFPDGWNETPAPSGIYDSSSRLYWRYPNVGVEDQFAIGCSDSMDIYSNVYINLPAWNPEGGEILLGKAIFGASLSPRWSNIRFKGLVKIDDHHSWYRSYYDEDYEKLDIAKLERVK